MHIAELDDPFSLLLSIPSILLPDIVYPALLLLKVFNRLKGKLMNHQPIDQVLPTELFC